MKVAITGGTGFIGSHLVEAFLARGWQVRILRHQRAPYSQEVTSCEGKIDQAKELFPFCQGADLVFHLACVMGSAQIKPQEFYRINVDGTRAILQAAKEARVARIVHVSSAGVLGAVPKKIIADEDFPANPITLYDRTKWLGEKVALEAAASNLDVVIIRPGWVYGPRDRRTFKLIRAIKRRLFLLVGKGDGRQSPIWIDDLIQGLLLASEKGRGGAIYHLTGGEILTVKQMALTIASSLGVNLCPISLPVSWARAGSFFFDKLGLLFRREMPLNSSRLSFFLHSKSLSIDKAKNELGFSPQVVFNEGIKKAIHWYREQGWL